jgi:hypothetical protein
MISDFPERAYIRAAVVLPELTLPSKTIFSSPFMPA